MGIKYRQLTEQDRVFIDLMLSKRYSKAKIATILKILQLFIEKSNVTA